MQNTHLFENHCLHMYGYLCISAGHSARSHLKEKLAPNRHLKISRSVSPPLMNLQLSFRISNPPFQGISQPFETNEDQ